jgi:hypothetical protein
MIKKENHAYYDEPRGHQRYTDIYVNLWILVIENFVSSGW